jgi:hypothetical protein
VWRERIANYFQGAGFASGCATTALHAAELDLGIALPADLRELLVESDGVLGEHELGLVWPLARIVEDNRSFRANPDFRELYMPFDHLLFFADAGNGDQFAFAIQAGKIRRPDIFVWDHESDSRSWVAPSLDRYFDWWISGRLGL